MACALNSLKKLIDFKGDVETEANKSLIDSLEKEIRRLKRELVEKDFQLNGKDAAFDSYRKTVEEQKLEDLMKEEVELEDGSYVETPEQVSAHDQPEDQATAGMEVQVASVVYRLDDFPELKKKIDRAVSNIELYGSDRYDHMKQVILKHESKFLTRVNALDRDPTSGRLSVRNDPEIIRIKERYSQKIHILQEALSRFRTLDRQLKSDGKKFSPKTYRRDLSRKLHLNPPPQRPPNSYSQHPKGGIHLFRLPQRLQKIRIRGSPLRKRFFIRNRRVEIRQARGQPHLDLPQKLEKPIQWIYLWVSKGWIWQNLL
jgi:hypothetical protein